MIPVIQFLKRDIPRRSAPGDDLEMFPHSPGHESSADLAACVEGGSAGGEHGGAAGRGEDHQGDLEGIVENNV